MEQMLEGCRHYRRDWMLIKLITDGSTGKSGDCANCCRATDESDTQFSCISLIYIRN
jgi:hypothetical protein